MSLLRFTVIFLALALHMAFAFTAPKATFSASKGLSRPKYASGLVFMADQTEDKSLVMAEKTDDQVVELGDVEEKGIAAQVLAPFLSQGEVSEEPMDLTDPKQARVMFYIILSLIPILFLLPLMLGSRDLIPLDALPPVSM
jgi:ABC-type Na+ efflux pump permease subunit